ncbi:hypothetical protein [Ruminococcus sp.]|uniref:hypothetical protein n=1 Tax=Ruminococcus sp. TaxID=41978 RepID=UPI002E76BE1C|nr:hypothetical protein [Ruminococcus sp.]MEE1264291.1 hypothetical protein [Ruminococcus sp.]
MRAVRTRFIIHCQLLTANCQLPNYQLPTAQLPTANCPTANCQLPNYQLPTAQLPTANYQLPTTQLPTTTYQLPTTNCQLPTTNYQLPTKTKNGRKGIPYVRFGFYACADCVNFCFTSLILHCCTCSVGYQPFACILE